MVHLSIEGLSVRYGDPDDAQSVLALEDITLQVQRGEFLIIVGPSGCGKSTLLSAVDGLLQPAAGTVLVNRRPVQGPGPDRAMVFQEFALLPWRTVTGNVEFGMELRRVPPRERAERIERLLAAVGLTEFAGHYPAQLSGGMKQRVGIARALAVDPEILLMDEPFGALDVQTRELMTHELLTLWEKDQKTVLFVTHSLDEAIYLGDRIVVLSARPGRIKAILPVDLPRPRTPRMRSSPEFVAMRDKLWELLEVEVQRAQGEAG